MIGLALLSRRVWPTPAGGLGADTWKWWRDALMLRTDRFFWLDAAPFFCSGVPLWEKHPHLNLFDGVLIFTGQVGD